MLLGFFRNVGVLERSLVASGNLSVSHIVCFVLVFKHEVVVGMNSNCVVRMEM